jgi:glycerol kinase
MTTLRAVLGIDQGTTGTRALVMGADGEVLATAYAAHRQHYPQPGWVEHDPAEIWAAVVATAAAAVRGAPSGTRIEAIGLANQGETVMAWDRASGEPLHPALVWQDQRTEAFVQELAQDPAFAGTVEELTGLRLDAYFSAPKMRWLLDHVPAVAQAAAAGKLCLGTLDAWMIWRLTGGRRFVTDPSTAARTLLFDIRRRSYDSGLLGRFGVPRAALPEIAASDGEFGVAALPEAGLAGVPIRASVVDQPAAMVGHGCLAAGDLKATYGTGCFVYLHTGAAPRPSRHGLLATVVWERAGATSYALDGGVLAAGSVVTWLRDRLGLIKDEQEIDSLLATLPTAGGGVLACVPALAGLGAPHWRREARGAFLGLDLGSDRRDLVRAALAGIAWQVVDVVRAMAADSGMQVVRLKADGGLTRSRSMMQLQADALGIPVEVVAEPEATAMGVCYLAARAAGLWTSDAEITRRIKVAETFQPRTSPAERTAAEQRYRRALAVVQGWRG